MHEAIITPASVIDFWRAAGPKRWFRKNPAFDRQFHDGFLAAHRAAAQGEYTPWLASGEGGLALCLLLDQFPRNAFRGTARMYATDSQAQASALALIASGLDQECEHGLRLFCYLPLAHAEDLACQRESLRRHRLLGERYVRDAEKHLAIIEQFGRFPHRNRILGRESSQAELDFLTAGGFKG